LFQSVQQLVVWLQYCSQPLGVISASAHSVIELKEPVIFPVDTGLRISTLYNVLPFLALVQLQKLSSDVCKGLFDKAVMYHSQYCSGEPRVNKIRRGIP
jgi:hypothetical protein